MQLALGGKGLQADSFPIGRRALQESKGHPAVTFHQKVLLCPQSPQTRQGHELILQPEAWKQMPRQGLEGFSCIFFSAGDLTVCKSSLCPQVQIYHSPQLSPPCPAPQHHNLKAGIHCSVRYSSPMLNQVLQKRSHTMATKHKGEDEGQNGRNFHRRLWF